MTIAGLPPLLPPLPATDKPRMRVLVACEYSGRVRDAFRQRGHDAISVDLLPTIGDPAYHIVGDVRETLACKGLGGWDLMIAFPPCTFLSAVNAYRWSDISEDRQEAIDFFTQLLNANIPKICVENPAGAISTSVRKPDQYVHPWQFGEPYTKRTGLWLKALPTLRKEVTIRPYTRPWVNGGNRGGMARRQEFRAMTFQGIARAMAMQWG